MNIDELTQQVCDHLAGKEIKIVWRNPPSSSAAGQTTKSQSGQLTIYVGNLTDADSRYRTLIHECAHARLDEDFIPVTGDRASGSVWSSPEDRKVWRAHPREERAKKQAQAWMDYAELYAYKYWQVGRSAMHCKLLSLMEWKESK